MRQHACPNRLSKAPFPNQGGTAQRRPHRAAQRSRTSQVCPLRWWSRPVREMMQHSRRSSSLAAATVAFLDGVLVIWRAGADMGWVREGRCRRELEKGWLSAGAGAAGGACNGRRASRSGCVARGRERRANAPWARAGRRSWGCGAWAWSGSWAWSPLQGEKAGGQARGAGQGQGHCSSTIAALGAAAGSKTARPGAAAAWLACRPSPSSVALAPAAPPPASRCHTHSTAGDQACACACLAGSRSATAAGPPGPAGRC